MKQLNPLTVAAAALLIPLALTACATATPYQPRQDGAGYTEQRLETNRYRVSFAGNTATPRETVENYVLYRAAEVTLANGYDHFVTTGGASSGETERSGSNVGVGFGGFSIGSGGGLGIGIGLGTGGGNDREYQGQADIVMFKGPKPKDNPRAFDAREIKTNLESQIRRPQQPGAAS